MTNIAIVCPLKNAVSETFIQAHRELIKGNIYFLYGGFVPTHSLQGAIAKNSEVYKRLKRILPVFVYDRIKTDPAKELEAFFKKNKVQVVLAEYGQTACGVLEICKKLSIPLIVHFHGSDAS